MELYQIIAGVLAVLGAITVYEAHVVTRTLRLFLRVGRHQLCEWCRPHYDDAVRASGRGLRSTLHELRLIACWPIVRVCQVGLVLGFARELEHGPGCPLTGEIDHFEFALRKERRAQA